MVASVTFPVAFTLMFGWSFSKRAIELLIAFTSPGADQPCQNFRVTGFVGSSSALPTLGLAQPDSSSPAAASATGARRGTRHRGMANVLYLYGGRGK